MRFREGAASLFPLAVCFAWGAYASTIPIRAELQGVEPGRWAPMSLALKDASPDEDDTALAGLAALPAPPGQADPGVRSLTPPPQPDTVKNPFLSTAP
jgi:hypothetical protein